MKILNFFKKLNREGIRLSLKDNNSINIKSSKEISGEIIEEIKTNKIKIIEFLKENKNEEKIKKYKVKGIEKESLLPKIELYDRPKDIPLSFGQERLWFIDQLEGSLSYHIPIVLELTGDLDVSVLEKSLKTIVSRHEVLRTNIYSKEGVGYQFVVSSDHWFLEKEDLEIESTSDSIESYISRPFDLSKDYKLRSCLYNIGSD
ncbi:condensation domain-containing protein, partial [Tenacibaculum xiamenense]|uniref:condensation domain-containing protein n=1 Tax=Tenacibaculum xiamenense TaxID=1261553 RepID=UPI0038B553BB